MLGRSRHENAPRRAKGVKLEEGTVEEVYKKLLAALSSVGTLGSIALFVGLTLLGGFAALLAIVWLPVDHFRDVPARERGYKHPVVRVLLIVTKNLLGFLVVLPMGIVMTLPLVPGPGLVFVLLGLSLVDFPGKRGLVRRILRYPSVVHFITSCRDRHGRAPFDLD